MGHDNHGSCSSGSCSQSHSGSSGSGCGCGSGGCGCGCGCKNCQCACHQKGGCHDKGKFAEELFSLADQAWMELLKEKIKAEILAQGGDNLNQLAKLVSSANHERWKDKMLIKKNCEDFESQLKNIMCSANHGQNPNKK